MRQDSARSHAKGSSRPELCLGWRPRGCREGPRALRAGRRGAGSAGRRLTALSLWPVGTVEQGLVRVPEELLPGHRVHKAEAGVAVDEGQPTAQFPQRAQPQPSDAQSLQGQRVGAAEGEECSAAGWAAHP